MIYTFISQGGATCCTNILIGNIPDDLPPGGSAKCTKDTTYQLCNLLEALATIFSKRVRCKTEPKR